MPGSAAETRADACRPSGAATLPVQVPLRYWFVGGSAVAVSGFGPGLPSPPSLLVTSASTGPGGAPVGGATVVVRAGRAPASFWRALLACSFATFTAWRPRLETASQPASRPRPTSGRLHRLHAGLRRCWVFAGTSRPPPAAHPPLIGLLCCFLLARNETNRGPIAWRQPGKLRLPRTRGPASTPPSPPGRSSPVAQGAGAVERVDDHTLHPWPSGTWLPPRSATTPSPRSGSTTCPCHGRVAWASSPCRRSPTLAAPTSAITRLDLTDLTRLSLQPST